MEWVVEDVIMQTSYKIELFSDSEKRREKKRRGA
jgi:hypothetical protein